MSDAPSDVRFAATPAGPIAYVRRGAGAPLLLIMGVGGHHGVWGEAFLDRLATRFDVVAMDNRGIGQSVRAEDGMSLDDLADDAVAVMNHLGWEAAHVMGISMGGAIAQVLALSDRDRVRSLVLGCTWAEGSDTWAPGVHKLVEASAAEDAATAGRLMFEANVSPGFAAGPGRLEEFLDVAAAVKVPGPVIGLQMNAAIVHDAAAGLASLDLPTLVIHGTADDVIKHEAGERLAAVVPGATLDLWDGVGHLFFWEQPERAADAVIKHALG